MEFLLDENIPVELIPWLNQRRHSAFSAPKGSPDEKIASLAKERKVILLTQDRHFSNILRFPPQDFSGIIRIKIHPSYIEDIAFSLQELFKTFTKAEDIKGKLIILEKEGYFKLKK